MTNCIGFSDSIIKPIQKNCENIDSIPYETRKKRRIPLKMSSLNIKKYVQPKYLIKAGKFAAENQEEILEIGSTLVNYGSKIKNYFQTNKSADSKTSIDDQYIKWQLIQMKQELTESICSNEVIAREFNNTRNLIDIQIKLKVIGLLLEKFLSGKNEKGMPEQFNELFREEWNTSGELTEFNGCSWYKMKIEAMDQFNTVLILDITTIKPESYIVLEAHPFTILNKDEEQEIICSYKYYGPNYIVKIMDGCYQSLKFHQKLEQVLVLPSIQCQKKFRVYWKKDYCYEDYDGENKKQIQYDETNIYSYCFNDSIMIKKTSYKCNNSIMHIPSGVPFNFEPEISRYVKEILPSSDIAAINKWILTDDNIAIACFGLIIIFLITWHYVVTAKKNKINHQLSIAARHKIKTQEKYFSLKFIDNYL